MKIRKVYGQKWIRKFHIDAITIYPFIIFSYSKEQVGYALYRHEMQHIYQVRQLGFFRFYLSYLWEFARNLVRYRDWDVAYWNISYEKEARETARRAVFELFDTADEGEKGIET